MTDDSLPVTAPMKRIQIFSALLLAVISFSSMAEDPCRILIQASDALTFDRTDIQIPASCKTATIVLQHTGRLPVAATGHNWVLTSQADLDRVARDGFRAGSAHGWIKPEDTRVIASTPIIGRGETAEVSLDVRALDPSQTYGFVCTVGGHSPRMRGILRIAPDKPAATP